MNITINHYGRSLVLARETGEEGTQSRSDWGGEGIEVEVPSSIPSCEAGWAPFFSRFTGEDVSQFPEWLVTET